MEEVENVGTKSEPFIMVVIKCFPDSAKSHVMQAAAKMTVTMQRLNYLVVLSTTRVARPLY